ncbi:putative Ig domain-containing protein [Thermus filiformis]|uniref:Uncharacterized protein n=1 Tax=Thermus filiformis TaxID=276 RepID=A0A0A2WRE9_THEFI|nr:putative Ig domain-containing protein [Thermus filiformis]KGQ21342.1 hypothetical protein THFILI_02175 [Thermus filiformis]
MRGTKLLRLLWLLALGLLAACNGGPPPHDLSLQGVSPQNPSVVQGQSLTLTLTFTSQSGFQGQVGLQVTEGGQAPGWLSFSPTSANLDVPKGGERSLTLTVRVSLNAPTGPHTLKLRAAYGNRTAEKDFTLTVTRGDEGGGGGGGGGQPGASFAISLSTDSVYIYRGSQEQISLTVTPQGGFTGEISLALEQRDGTPAPAGITLNPTSIQVTGPDPVTQPLNLRTDTSVTPGTYDLRIRATSGNIHQTADLSLGVFRVVLDLREVYTATRPEGVDGPITVTGTLEGSYPNPLELELQLAYRPKGGEWGPWQTVASFQVQGNQVQATIPAPGLDLPVGLDELGKQMRVGLATGGRLLTYVAYDYTLFRYRPLWSQAPGQGFRLSPELSANGNLLCGYGTKQDNSADVVFCLDPGTGETRWTYTIPTNTGFIHDILVTEGGKVYVAQGNRVRVLQNGAELAQYDLSGDFAYVTALAVEGDILYAAGSYRVDIRCDHWPWRAWFMRVRLGKYRTTGSTLIPMAHHDFSPEELMEEVRDGGSCFWVETNFTSFPAVRLENGKLYAVVAGGDLYNRTTGGFGGNPYKRMGILRLDANSFSRDWFIWDKEVGSSWSPAGYFIYFTNDFSSCETQGEDCPVIWYALVNFDLGDTQLYANYMGQDVLRKEDGTKETLEGGNPSFLSYLLFLPNGFVRFGSYSSRTVLEAYPGGTEGPYRLAGWESDTFSPTLYKDAQGRVYVYGIRNGELRVARIR